MMFLKTLLAWNAVPPRKEPRELRGIKTAGPFAAFSTVCPWNSFYRSFGFAL
jgi:hypothetical protein